MKVEQKWIIVAAGPFSAADEGWWNGEGLVIIRADSLTQAQEIAATDPMQPFGA